uniref:ARAD1B08360p n=1 Tax=Blastobotrys adeninivorans TaxID=409370 RepID=A0A060T650_BLAAD
MESETTPLIGTQEQSSNYGPSNPGPEGGRPSMARSHTLEPSMMSPSLNRQQAGGGVNNGASSGASVGAPLGGSPATAGGGGLANRLSRRPSPNVRPPQVHRLGPQRTSFTTQKLKLLPDEPISSDNVAADRNVYSQASRIKDTPARKDAERLGKAHRSMLPRVTAYCTAGSYRMKDLTRYLSGRKSHDAKPMLFDECLYTPYSYKRDRSMYESDVIRIDDEGGEIDVSYGGRSDVFVFEYGVTVLWGFTEHEERRFLRELARFESEKLSDEDVQVEEFNYYVTKSYQPRIYNDFITLRDNSNYMIKLSISHALAQSTKISLFEELVDNTIEDTQDFPQEVALTGKINMDRKSIMMSIGELFILRININLHGSILDSPELMWSEPQLEPIYQAMRGYLEINQRVALLNARLEVISDLLQMLKEQLGHANEEYLEFIVIVLIAVEILVAVVNVAVDYMAEKL